LGCPVPIGTKDVEVLVVKTFVNVGIPPTVVGTAVRVVITVTEALKLWVLRAGLRNGAVSVPATTLAKT
jgi:hypothetical protein